METIPPKLPKTEELDVLFLALVLGGFQKEINNLPRSSKVPKNYSEQDAERDSELARIALNEKDRSKFHFEPPEEKDRMHG